MVFIPLERSLWIAHGALVFDWFRISQHSADNSMTNSNLAIVFGPTLFGQHAAANGQGGVMVDTTFQNLVGFAVVILLRWQFRLGYSDHFESLRGHIYRRDRQSWVLDLLLFGGVIWYTLFHWPYFLYTQYFFFCIDARAWWRTHYFWLPILSVILIRVFYHLGFACMFVMVAVVYSSSRSHCFHPRYYLLNPAATSGVIFY